MLSISDRWKECELVYSEPPQDYIKAEAKKIFEIVESFCNVSGLDVERIEYNYPTIKDIIVRLDMRLMYFHTYHNKMNINEYKLVSGLIIFWILKLRPFWVKIKTDDTKETINMATNINEQIALHIAVGLLKEYNQNFFENGKNLVGQYCKEMLYSFRFRDLSKESLYLMFDPFYFLHLFEKSVDENGVNVI